MRETAGERSSDFDEKKLTDSLPPKEFQSATFVKYTFHKRIACWRGFTEHERRCQMGAIRGIPRASTRTGIRSKGCETRRMGQG
jgi:hypothetical protein